MQNKKMRKARYLAVLWVILAAFAVIGATYAWFTFSPATNVEPVSGTISNGNVNLLISNNPNTAFDVSCVLTPDSNPDVLKPLSTADLNQFFSASAQNQSGISILYKDVTGQYGENGIHGTVYLKSQNGSCDVYFYRSGMNFGSDIQTLAALRLGMKITTQSGTSTYIFRLDDMGATGSAQSIRTVPQSGTVVSTVSGGGSPVYVSDPASDLSRYLAGESSANDAFPTAGETRLAALSADEVASVEYWLYLEGCDDNCINEVQNRNFSLQLAFAGVATE